MTAVRQRRSRAGDKFGVVSLCDRESSYEALAFGDTWDAYRHVLAVGAVLCLTLSARLKDGAVRAYLVDASPIDEALIRRVGTMSLRLSGREALPLIAAALVEEGETRVEIAMGESGPVALPGLYARSPALVSGLRDTPGVAEIDLRAEAGADAGDRRGGASLRGSR